MAEIIKKTNDELNEQSKTVQHVSSISIFSLEI